ncbi:DUF397 domain-containing protein [Streptomyces sp. Z26]|uniref:DUF397 domain-containing protein n=1 Tax=Streptomyces sp. Z26 TaxID=2500177 RepID=UPI000EF135DF|nr:DUF397 domain-containing protein [Streptomyces sp. Z26]RLL69672.1 DUF397 domain-containing protein [Streptomyces sp. Z26]
MSITRTTDDTLHWTKSTYSTNEGASCVEIAAVPDSILVRDSKDKAGPRLTFDATAWDTFLADTVLEWTKSTHSDFEDAACVEIAAVPGSILVRDSKHTTGPRLTFTPTAWGTFLRTATEG